MEWGLLITGFLLGIVWGLYPPWGLASLVALIILVPVMWIVDPLGAGPFFYVAFALAAALPCLTMVYLLWRREVRKVERRHYEITGERLL